MNFPLLKSFQVDEPLVIGLNSWLDNRISAGGAFDENNSFSRRGYGYQTENLAFANDPALVTLRESLLSIAAEQLGLPRSGIRPFWLHMLEYDAYGSMERHKHDHNEDFVLFIYLKDCSDGDTVWYLNNYDPDAMCRTTFSLKPRAGMGAIFSALVLHEGLATVDGKRVCVCGIRLSGE